MSDFYLDDLVPNEDVPPLDSLDTPVSAINFDDLFVSSVATKRGAWVVEEDDDDEQLSHHSKRRCVRDTSAVATVSFPSSSCWPTYLTLDQLDQSITQFFEDLEESDVQVDVSRKQWNILHMTGSAYVLLTVQLFERFAAHEVHHCVHVNHLAGSLVLFQQVNGLLGSSLLHPQLDFGSSTSSSSSATSSSASPSTSPMSLFGNPVMREMIRFRAGVLLQPVSLPQPCQPQGVPDSDVLRTEAAGFLCGVIEDCRHVREMASLYDTYLVPNALLRCFDSPTFGWTQTFALRALLRLSELDGRYIDLITVHASFAALIRFMSAVEESESGVAANDFARMARHFSAPLRETLMASAASHLFHSLVSSSTSSDVSPAVASSSSRGLLMARWPHIHSETTGSPLPHVSCRG